MHLTQFTLLRFFHKATAPTIFIQFQPNFAILPTSEEVMQAYAFIAICHIKTKYSTLKILSTQDHMELKNSNFYSSYSFHPSSARLL